MPNNNTNFFSWFIKQSSTSTTKEALIIQTIVIEKQPAYDFCKVKTTQEDEETIIKKK